jgi:membrane fusion protein (multidrug efflux system)
MKQDTQLSTFVTTTIRPGRWRWPLVALVLIGAAGGGWVMTHTNDTVAAKVTDNNYVTDNFGNNIKKVIAVYELASSDISTIETRELQLTLPISGSLIPAAQVMVKAKAAGDVHGALVQEGMRVASGQVLARVEAADLRARLATQNATLDEAHARLSLAQKNSDSNSLLLKKNYISQNAFDTAQNSVDLAKASVRSATSTVEIARLSLADTVVRAPISGIVSKRHVQPGEKVSPDVPLYTIVNLSQMTLEAQVPASEIPRVKVDQQVVFHVDGFQGRLFSGKVARINPTTEAGSRSILVYVTVDNADGALKGGMFGQGSITTDKTDATPLLPLAALRSENGRDVVYTIENTKVVARPVKLGLRNTDEGMAEITSGLVTGSRIIVAKLDGVKPGSTVKIAESGPVTPTAASTTATASTTQKKS